jgi:hypothetical protein
VLTSRNHRKMELFDVTTSINCRPKLENPGGTVSLDGTGTGTGTGTESGGPNTIRISGYMGLGCTALYRFPEIFSGAGTTCYFQKYQKVGYFVS